MNTNLLDSQNLDGLLFLLYRTIPKYMTTVFLLFDGRHFLCEFVDSAPVKVNIKNEFCYEINAALTCFSFYFITICKNVGNICKLNQ